MRQVFSATNPRTDELCVKSVIFTTVDFTPADLPRFAGMVLPEDIGWTVLPDGALEVLGWPWTVRFTYEGPEMFRTRIWELWRHALKGRELGSCLLVECWNESPLGGAIIFGFGEAAAVGDVEAIVNIAHLRDGSCTFLHQPATFEALAVTKRLIAETEPGPHVVPPGILERMEQLYREQFPEVP